MIAQNHRGFVGKIGTNVPQKSLHDDAVKQKSLRPDDENHEPPVILREGALHGEEKRVGKRVPRHGRRPRGFGAMECCVGCCCCCAESTDPSYLSGSPTPPPNDTFVMMALSVNHVLPTGMTTVVACSGNAHGVLGEPRLTILTPYTIFTRHCRGNASALHEKTLFRKQQVVRSIRIVVLHLEP